MNGFLIAATAMLAGFVPILWVCVRGQPIEAVVALELGGAFTTTILLCLAAGFARPSYLDLPVAAAVLSAVSGLVFARFLGDNILSVVVDLLLGVAVAAQLICAAGLALSRTAADRLHYASAGYTVGPVGVLVAILVRQRLDSAGLGAIAAVGLLFLTGPLVVHATGRAVRRLEVGQLAARPGEGVNCAARRWIPGRCRLAATGRGRRDRRGAVSRSAAAGDRKRRLRAPAGGAVRGLAGARRGAVDARREHRRHSLHRADRGQSYARDGRGAMSRRRKRAALAVPVVTALGGLLLWGTPALRCSAARCTLTRGC